MGKARLFGMAIFVFICIDLYLGLQLLQRFEVFRLRNVPVDVEILVEDPPGVIAADIDKDGNDELIFLIEDSISNEKLFRIVERNPQNGQISDRSESLRVPSKYSFYDAYWDETLKSCVFRFLDSSGGTPLLKEISHHSGLKNVLLEPLKYRLTKRDSVAERPVFVDLDGDGKMEELVQLNTFYSAFPRGLVCFENGPGKLLWQFYCGTFINMLQAKDLDDDGKKEIVLSTGGISNGAVMDGTDDAHSYVIVLDHKGKVRWKQVTGEWYTHAWSVIADVDNDGIPDIITATTSHSAHPEIKGKLFVFDGKTGERKAFFSVADDSISRPYARKYLADSADKKLHTVIYAGDASGRIRMFDHRLKLIKSSKVDSPVMVLNGYIPSIDWNFLLLLTPDGLLGFDWDLEKKVFDYPLGNSPELYFFNSDLIFIPFHTTPRTDALLYKGHVYRLSKTEMSVLRVAENLAASGLLLMGLALVSVNIFFVYIARYLGKNGARAGRKNGIIETARFMGVVQETAHKLKNPISTIQWTTEKIKRSIAAVTDTKIRTSYAELSAFLQEDVALLKQQTNHLLKVIQIYSPRFRQIALKPFLQNMVNHYRALLQENLEIRLEMDEDILLSIDEELVKEALVNLVDNAIEAMPEGGRITIAVVTVSAPVKGSIKEVLIELEDTGQGIEPEDLAQVFEPFFSRKQTGTGIGLTICQRIIHAHQGTINIHSRKNFGTKVAIMLPVTLPGKKRRTIKG
jgi:signal transduction histidine kinase